MRTNQEMRDEAWKIVRGKWFWRMLSAGLLLNLIGQLAMGIVNYLYKDMEIPTWVGFLQSKVEALRSGMNLTLPSSAAGWRMTGASAFEIFVYCLFAAIMAFGIAGIALKAIRNDEKEWFPEAFAGYRRPLDVTWFFMLLNLKVLLWSLLFVIPGVVAAYRYRQAWYLKVENPSWSASKCLSESGKMMNGYKWRAFAFDMSYSGWIALLVVMAGATAVITTTGSGLSALVGGFLGLGTTLLVGFLLCYYFMGRTVFYREVKASRPTDGANEAAPQGGEASDTQRDGNVI